MRSRDRSGSFREERETKRNHGVPTGCFWRPLKSAAAAANLESPRAWSSKTRGYRSARAGGGSGLFPRRVGPFSRGALARLQTPEGAKLTSHGRCARTPRARAVLRDNPEAAGPRREARAPRAAAGRCASPRLTQLRCAALRRDGTDILRAHGGGCPAPRRSPLAALGVSGQSSSDHPGAQQPRGRAAPAGRETPPGPRPRVAPRG